MEIKKVGIGLDYSSYEELKKYHVLSQGWWQWGDLSFFTTLDGQIENYASHVPYYNQGCKNAFRNLFCDIKPGCIVVAMEGNTLRGIAEMPDDFIYFYNNDVEEYKNSLFPVNWVDWEIFCKDPSLKFQGGQGVQGIQDFNVSKFKEYIENNWQSFKEKTKYDPQLHDCDKKLTELKNNFQNKILQSKKAFEEHIKEQRLNMIKEQYDSFRENIEKFLKRNFNMILTGAPGTGKTYLARQIAAKILGYGDDISKLNNNPQFGFTQFHPSYDYVDFVEGLRPNDDPNGREFVYKKGIFKSFCEVAAKDIAPEHKYVFVIDEINRGDISKIFGELFFSVDPGYRREENRILVKTQYQSMIPQEDKFYSGFYVPENVYIIGTMNDIDRSVESLDFAFRRRFPTIEVKVEDTLDAITAHLSDAYREDAKKRLRHLNKKISEDENFGSSYCIGGSYLLKLKELEDDKYQSLWDYYIKNLLLEYLRGFEREDIKSKMNNFAEAFGVSANIDSND